jgi:ABC-type sugar transport system substrate-binding protein
MADWRETLQMSIVRPAGLQRRATSSHEIVPIESRPVEQHQDRTGGGLRGDPTESKRTLPGPEGLRLSRRNAMRLGSSWLCGLVVPAALAATTPPAWGADIRVGFINPWGPPEFWRLVSATMQAAAAELGIEVEERHTERSFDRAIGFAREFLNQRPPPDYLIATNDLGAGGELIKLADAAGVPLILLNNELEGQQWAEYGQPRTKYRHWLGSIVPDHESGGYGIAEAVLIEAARIKKHRPLKVLALAGEIDTPASNDRVRGLKRAIGVMGKVLGPRSVDLIEVRNLDWSQKRAEASMREFVKNGPRIDALWAANDPMAFGAITALREAGYTPGVDVVVGGLNWSGEGIERVLKREMIVTHGGHFLSGAWAMVLVRDYHDGRDFAEEDVRLQFPMGAIDLPVAQRLPEAGKIDWRQIDFAQFSKTRNAAITRYNFTPDAVLSRLASNR